MDNIFEKAKQFISEQDDGRDSTYTSDQREALNFVSKFLLEIGAITVDEYHKLGSFFIKGVIK